MYRNRIDCKGCFIVTTDNNMPCIGVEMMAPEFGIEDLDLYEYVVTSERDPCWELRRYYMQFPNVLIAIQQLEKFQELLKHRCVYSCDLHNDVLAGMLDVTISSLMNERKFYECVTFEKIPVKIYV